LIKVLVSDDHAVLRAGVKEILTHGFQNIVCGEAADAEQIFASIQGHDWDMVILDLNMPGRSGVDVLRELKRLRPMLPVLVLSMHPEDQYGKRLLRAGASGYLNKDVAPEELIKAVRKVIAGGRYVSAALAEKLAFDLSEKDAGRAGHENLSEREFEVLRLIASGKTVSEIAEQIHLSVPTVSTYRARILSKLNMTTTAELMRYGLENRIVD
jgi:two-component system, NarL family, invasion response regulator UvrY